MKRLPWYFWIGAFGLPVSFGLMVAGLKPISIYFYVFVWWFYIILIDSLVFWIKGVSLLTRLRVKIILLIFCSFFFWLFFELLNLRIANWYYVGPFFHPIGMVIFGIFAFGTVLPAIMETYEFLESISPWRYFKFPCWKWWGKPHYLWMSIGGLMLILSLIWPRYFVWMIWFAVIFILDPSIDKKGGRSLFSELREGNIRTIYLLLLTGLICGFLWEFWNYWAGLRWEYTVTLFGRYGDWKIFEMPVLGYLGFLPFTLECYVFYNWLVCQKADLERIMKR